MKLNELRDRLPKTHKQVVALFEDIPVYDFFFRDRYEDGDIVRSGTYTPRVFSVERYANGKVHLTERMSFMSNSGHWNVQLFGDNKDSEYYRIRKPSKFNA